MKYLIIDGYNAISKIREFDIKKDISLESSRLAFIKALVDFKQRNGKFGKIIVVFDGKGDGLGLERETYGNIEALFSHKDKDADKVIIDILKISLDKDKITVSSDDNFVKNHARAFGCNIMSIKELEDLIVLKKKLKGVKIKEDIQAKKMDEITEELKRHWGAE